MCSYGADSGRTLRSAHPGEAQGEAAAACEEEARDQGLSAPSSSMDREGAARASRCAVRWRRLLRPPSEHASAHAHLVRARFTDDRSTIVRQRSCMMCARRDFVCDFAWRGRGRGHGWMGGSLFSLFIDLNFDRFLPCLWTAGDHRASDEWIGCNARRTQAGGRIGRHRVRQRSGHSMTIWLFLSCV